MDDISLYLSLDLPIIPLCSWNHEGMTEAHCLKCASPGKVPLIANWTQWSKTSPSDVKKWQRAGQINYGLPLGRVSEIIGIDIDTEQGEQLVKQLDLPETWEFSTGRGKRLLFSYKGPETKKYIHLVQGKEAFSILGDGQQTVLPPSIHNSGTPYVWTKSPREIPIAVAPPNVVAFICKTPIEVLLDSKIGEGSRNNHLLKVAGSLVGKGMPRDQVHDYLLYWNRENCNPPLPVKEIDAMLSVLYTKEAIKISTKSGSTTRGKSLTEPFKPSKLAEEFLIAQSNLGIQWKYSAEQGSMFKFISGPWIKQDQVGIQKSIREYISPKGYDSVSYVQEVLAAVKELVLCDTEGMFDIGRQAEKFYNKICLADGILYWQTGEFVPWSPDILSTIKLPVTYKPGVRSDIWESALEQWLPDLASRQFLQKYIGLSLIPDNSYRIAVFLYGKGANGKSMFLDAIRTIFGDALVSIPLHRITQKFEVASLQNKLINICADIDSRYMEETSVLKGLISGDILRGEHKFGKSFDFAPVARLIFSANTLPIVADKSHAWYSRWAFIHFDQTFEIDSEFKRSFIVSREAIFNWALEGLLMLKGVGVGVEGEEASGEEASGLQLAPKMLQHSADYLAINDPVVAFVNEVLERVLHVGRDTQVPSLALYRLYVDWCSTMGYQPCNNNHFSQRIQATGIEKARRPHLGKTTVVYIGVQVVSSWNSTYNSVVALYR